MLVTASLAVLVVLLGVCIRLTARIRTLTAELAGTRRDAELSRSALDHLQQRDSVKDEFISTVSHELRTPLTSIRGALGLLSSGVLGKVDDRAANLLRIASNNTDRLVRLINDILDLQRMDSGAAPLPMRLCAVDDLLRNAVETMNPMAEAADVQLQISQYSQSALAVEGNADRLVQVLCNLLSNAIKFSPGYAVVSLRATAQDGVLVLRVEDSGRGVPADKLETIFERFGQVEPSDARQKGGTGLGLAICRSIITQHRGTIHALRNDSLAPGRPGATMVIHLPLSSGKPEVPATLHHLLA